MTRFAPASRPVRAAGPCGLLCCLWVIALGCTAPISLPGKSPLVAPQLSPDSAVFDVVIVRIPCTEQAAAQNIWEEIDEQHLPAEVRTRLTQNGFRAGVVGTTLPIGLSKLLDLQAQPSEQKSGTTIALADLAQPIRNEHRHMPLRSGRRGEVVTSGTYDQLPVLIRTEDGVCGQTYAQAQALLAVTPTLLPDGRVKIDVTPELHHDQPRQRWVGDHGILRLEAGRPRRVFDELAVSATLSPGEMLIFGCLPDRPGSLGHNFFSESGEQPVQKLVIFRLVQTQHSGLYGAQTPAAATEAN